jgi:subtilisin family serine protease
MWGMEGPTRLAFAGLLVLAGLSVSAPIAQGGSPTGISPRASGFLGAVALAPTTPAPLTAPAPFRPGVVLVGFRPGVSVGQQYTIERRAGGSGARHLGPSIKPAGEGRAGRHPLLAPLELRVGGTQVLAAIRRLRRNRAVAYAEPDYLMRASAQPNDPSFSQQWASSNTGQSIPTQEAEEILGPPASGTPGADDSALKAWGVSTGSRSIVIGETDTGVAYNHPDLAANIWSNPGGIGGCSAGTHGYSVLKHNCEPMDDDTVYGGHGTHVAGIMGAVGNNGVGVAGMNWQTSILPVKWLGSSAWGETSGLIEALQWLVAAKQAGINVRVVNDSATFRGTEYSQALSDEIDTLGANNILFVTAAGNTGENNDELAQRRYPCGYDRPNEICVTASNNSDQLPGWANYGSHTVDLAAPGVSIYSTLRNGTYGYLSGGSMASPQVAGAAALILSVEPSLSATALKADILENVDKLPSLSGRVITGGRLNVCRALPGCSRSPTAPPVDIAPPTISGTAQTGRALSAGTGSWSESPTSYAYQWQRCDTTGANCSSISGATAQTYTLGSPDVNSTLRVSVTASNSAGSSTPSMSAQTAVVSRAPLTFGKTTIGVYFDGGMYANYKIVHTATLSVSGQVTKLSLYATPGASSPSPQGLKAVIYADSGGSPGALLATGTEVTYRGNINGSGWFDLPFAAPVTLTPGTYWLGFITGSTTEGLGYAYDSVANSRAYNPNSYASGPTNPFGSSTKDSEQASIYATYTPVETKSRPVDSTLPTITGLAQVGQQLTASPGTWTESPTNYAYQWQRCDSIGANCSLISGATAQAYTLGSPDLTKTLRVSVTASNSAGSSAPASSAQTAVIVQPPATFGKTSVGAYSDAFASERKRVNRYALSTAGSLTKLSLYLAPTATSGQEVLKGILYADSATAPGGLLGVTEQLTFKSTNTAGWYDLVFHSAVNLAAGNYWIGVMTGPTASVAGFRFDSVSGSRDFNSNPFASGPTNPFGAVTVDSEQMSIYATYTPG